MKIKYASLWDIGLKAKENQDRILCVSNGSEGLFAVADGMGGMENGSFASSTIIRELETWWTNYCDQTVTEESETNGVSGLENAIHKANEKIYSATEPGTRCGSTVVALLLEGNSYTVVNCGDSRCYQAERELLLTHVKCLTTDDIWENVKSNVEGLSEKEIQKHKNHGKLVRAVGTGRNCTCTIQKGTISRKNVFLLCSDGMHKRVNGQELNNILKGGISEGQEYLKESCESLKKKVYQRGAGDNISIIMLKVDRE